MLAQSIKRITLNLVSDQTFATLFFCPPIRFYQTSFEIKIVSRCRDG